MSEYYVLHKSIVPEAMLRVLAVKLAIEAGDFSEVKEACEAHGLSRSTYYKYAEKIFPFKEDQDQKRATLSLLLDHKVGSLTSFLGLLSSSGCNIITIHQDPPSLGRATVKITFDISKLQGSLEDLLTNLENLQGISKLHLQSIV